MKVRPNWEWFSCIVFWSEVDGLRGDSKVRGVNLGGWLVVEGWIKPSLFDGIPNGDMLVSAFSKFGCFYDSWI
jgi:hypothetical protein